MSDRTNAELTRILLVDDDLELCDLVGRYLATRGFQVDFSGDGADGLERALRGDYALLVLDVMLPSLDGFEVLRRLRATPGSALPVVMLTAHGDEVDRIVGLELGADDYLPKPFNPRELLARIRAILRRSTVEPQGQPLEPSNQTTTGIGVGADSASIVASRIASTIDSRVETIDRLVVDDIVLDQGARMVWLQGAEVELTATEFDLLKALMSAAGRVTTREELAQDVLERRLLPFDRSLDLHISKLRRKIGQRSDGRERIKTVRGVGYILLKNDS